MAGVELEGMVPASLHGGDRYAAPEWMAIPEFLGAHPRDSEADALRDWVRSSRRAHLQYGRRYFGWGVFVLRVA